MNEDAPVYGCCQHCADFDELEEWCSQAPHDDACVQPYCSGGRPVVGVVAPEVTP